MLSHVQQTGLVLFPVALIGAIFNWTVIFLIFKLPTFKHSFGFLSANQAIADAIHSTTFLLFFCPMAVFENEFLQYHSKHCGFMLLFCYELSVHTHFAISLNRLFAVFAPYNERNTLIIISFIWVITLSTTFTYYEVLCSMYYNEKTGFFFFTDSDVCNFIAWYTDFCKNLAVVVIIVIIDVSTVIRVRLMSRKVRNSAMTANTQERLSHRELNFLRQTVFQGALFTLELVTYFVIPPYLENKWAIFFCTSFAWVMVHAADGIVAILCNPDFRKYFFRWGAGKVSTVATAAHTISQPAMTQHEENNQQQ